MKTTMRFIIAFSLFIFIPVIAFSQETFTLTTYYPSPYGSYNQLTTYGNTYLAATSGNVGIGTTAPLSKLHVVQADAGAVNPSNLAFATIENNDNAYLQILTPDNRNSGILFGTPTRGNIIGQIGYMDTPRILQFSANGGSNPVAINANGFVGIGTTAPAMLLSMRGAVNNTFASISDGASNLLLGIDGSGGKITLPTPGVDLVFSVGGMNFNNLVLDTLGNVGIGTAAPAARMEVQTGSVLLRNASAGLGQFAIFNANTGNGDNLISFNDAGNARMAVGYSTWNASNTGFITLTNGVPLRIGYDALVSTPTLFVGANAGGVIGNVGVGSASPQAQLDVNTTAAGRRTLLLESASNANNVYIIQAVNPNGEQFRVSSSGQLVVSQQLHVGPSLGLAGSFSVEGIGGASGMPPLIYDNSGGSGQVYWDSLWASSRRNKEQIEPLKEDFYKILKLAPKTFIYKTSGMRGIGYIAEDLDEMGLKALVIYDKDKQPVSIQYDKISLYLLEIVKDQQQELAGLKKELAELKAKIK